jgi:hypothetical protein
MNSVIKRLTILLLLLTFAASGAFALNLSLGISGSLYMSQEELDNSSRHDIWAQFENGEGIYYGLNGELLFNKWAIGLYTYFSFYEWEDSGVLTFDMMDADINFSLSNHFFGTKSFIDPFVEAGFGAITRSITAFTPFGGEKEELDEPFTYLGTEYWFLGVGLGINIGSVGVFTKLQYHDAIGPVTVEDNEQWGTYTTDDFPLKKYKVVLGGKIIL